LHGNVKDTTFVTSYTIKQNKIMENSVKRPLSFILKDMEIANKNIAKFIKLGKDEIAMKWCEQLEKLEKEAGIK